VQAGVGTAGIGGGPDPVLDVAGIAAAELIARIEQIRGGERPGVGRLPIRLHVGASLTVSAGLPVGGLCLLDLADLSDADFVWQAHRVLLGRAPSSAEVDRRLGDLRTRSSRLGLVVRLGLSPEGRRAQRSETRGIGLPALALVAGAIESAASLPILSRVAAGSERIVRSSLNGAGSGMRRGVVSTTTVGVTIAVRRRIRNAFRRGGAEPGSPR
jgi:hypothetical protein